MVGHNPRNGSLEGIQNALYRFGNFLAGDQRAHFPGAPAEPGGAAGYYESRWVELENPERVEIFEFMRGLKPDQRNSWPN